MPIRLPLRKYSFANRDLLYWQAGVIRLWLPFYEESGVTTHDVSKYANDGTITDASWADGILGKAIEFDADGELITVTHAASLSMTDLTVALWYKPLGLGHMIDKRTGDSALKGWFLRQDNDGQITFELWNGGASAIDALQTTVFGYGVFHFLVGVFKAGEYMKIYKNGVQVAGKTSTATGVCNGDSNITIGTHDWSDPANWFDGIIDEVRVYNKALTAEEILALYRAVI